jgi:hypothetical protein
MSQSEDSDSGEDNEGLSLAGFLFGNVGTDGKLEDNFLDEASKRKLGGLTKLLGLGSLIQDEDLVGRANVKGHLHKATGHVQIGSNPICVRTAAQHEVA